MKTILNFLLARLREPSTWAALPSLALAVGVTVPGDAVGPVTQIGVGLAGLAGVLLSERGRDR